MTRNLGQATLIITANPNQFLASLQSVGGALNSLGLISQSISTRMQALSTSLNTIGNKLIAFGFAVKFAFVPIFDTVSKFEQTMARIKSVTIDSLRESAADGLATLGEQFDALRAKALELGTTTRFSATEVAEAMFALGQAGLTAEQILRSTEATLNLATAGFIDLGRASEITVNIMTAFALTVEDNTRIVDGLAKAAAISTTDIQELGKAFSYVAPVAGAMGQTFEDTSATLATLANAGLRSSVAGTGLAQILSRLAQQGREVTKIANKYNIALQEIDPTQRSIIEIFEEFANVGVTAGDAMDAFGERAGRAFLAILSNISTLDSFTGQIKSAAGSAEEMSRIMRDNVRDGALQLLNTLKNLAIEGFSTVAADVDGLIKRLTESVKEFTAWISANKTLVAESIKSAASYAKYAIQVGVASKALSLLINITNSYYKTLKIISDTGLFRKIAEGIGLIHSKTNLKPGGFLITIQKAMGFLVNGLLTSIPVIKVAITTWGSWVSGFKLARSGLLKFLSVGGRLFLWASVAIALFNNLGNIWKALKGIVTGFSDGFNLLSGAMDSTQEGGNGLVDVFKSLYKVINGLVGGAIKVLGTVLYGISYVVGAIVSGLGKAISLTSQLRTEEAKRDFERTRTDAEKFLNEDELDFYKKLIAKGTPKISDEEEESIRGTIAPSPREIDKLHRKNLEDEIKLRKHLAELETEVRNRFEEGRNVLDAKNAALRRDEENELKNILSIFQEINSVRDKGTSASVREKEQLANNLDLLQEEGQTLDKLVHDLEEKLKLRNSELEAIKNSRGENSDQYKDEEIALANLASALKTAKDERARFLAQQEKGIAASLQSAEAARASAKEEIELNRIREEGAQARKELESSGELDRILEALQLENLDAFEQELKKLEIDINDVQQKISDMLANIDKVRLASETAYKSELKTIDDRIKKKKEELENTDEGEIERRAQINKSIEKLEKSRIEVKIKYINDRVQLQNKENDINVKKAQLDKAFLDKERRIFEEREKDRKEALEKEKKRVEELKKLAEEEVEFLEDQVNRIRKLQREQVGDELGAKRIDAEQKLQEKLRQIREKFDPAKDPARSKEILERRKLAEQNAIREANLEFFNDLNDLARKNDDANESRKNELAIEQEIGRALGQKVNSIRQLILLQQALFYLQDQQGRRALAVALQTDRLEQIAIKRAAEAKTDREKALARQAAIAADIAKRFREETFRRFGLRPVPEQQKPLGGIPGPDALANAQIAIQNANIVIDKASIVINEVLKNPVIPLGPLGGVPAGNPDEVEVKEFPLGPLGGVPAGNPDEVEVKEFPLGILGAPAINSPGLQTAIGVEEALGRLANSLNGIAGAQLKQPSGFVTETQIKGGSEVKRKIEPEINITINNNGDKKLAEQAVGDAIARVCDNPPGI